MRCGASPTDGRNRLSLYLIKADDVIGDGILNFWEKPFVQKKNFLGLKLFFLDNFFSCRTKSAAALGTTFGLVLLLSVISKCVIDSISNHCYKKQCRLPYLRQ